MGKCMTKVRVDRENQTYPLGDNIIKVRQRRRSSTAQQQFQSELPTRKQMEYWRRRFVKICGANNNYISEREMREMFKYMDLDKETIKKLHEIFKNDKEILDNESFFQGIKKIGSSNNFQLTSTIYTLYFENSQLRSSAVLQRFESQFKPFIKGYRQQQSSRDISSSQNLQKTPEGKMKQLKILLDQRKSYQDSNQVQKWLIKNIYFRKFRYHLLEKGLQIDEQQAYKQFWIDYNNVNESRLGNSNLNQQNKQGQEIIINWRWCQRMIRYMNQKFEIQGAPKIKRRPTIDATSVLWNNQLRRKQSIDMMMFRSSIHEPNKNMPNINQMPYMSHLGNYRRSSQTNNVVIDPSKFRILQKQPQWYTQPKNHPGEIDNTILIGNFEWELKRNIRKDVDYVTLKDSTYEQLVMCFGGGPKLKRKTIQGYLQLRPYFVVAYLFSYDKATDNGTLSQEELIRISSSDPVSFILTDKTKTNICYHRNVGGEWEKFPSDNPQQKNKKVIDVFSETSFLVYMSFNNQKYFKDVYIQKTTRPTIGQIYQSQLYKVVETIEDRDNLPENIQVCVVDDQQPGFVSFVVLNWSYHLQRKIPLTEFIQKFKIVKTGLKTSVRKNRAGISNMGNTCYMNASLQAILSVYRDEYLASLQGELGIELREISRKIKQRKKSVFPVDFKTVFDKHFEFFKGQDQHDAHQFCLCLFGQFESDNKKMTEKILQLKIKQTNKCTRCQKVQQIIVPSFIISLPLRDFQKKQVKIDYIIDNKTVQTVVFTIEEQCKVEDWKKNFEKASGAKDFYLCEVENSDIIRTFNKEDKLDNQLFKDLRIENQFLITAYETKTIKSNLKLQKHYDFRTYKDSRGNCFIARVEEDVTELLNKPLRQSRQSNGLIANGSSNGDLGRKLKIRVHTGSDFEEKIVKESELYHFPEAYPAKESYIKIINFDHTYNQKIGRPFIFKIPSTYPISVIRQALENYIGKSGYFLRVSPVGEPSKCQICRRSFQTNSQCFKQRENFSPICWVEGRIQFVVAWYNVSQYNNLVRRVKYTSTNLKSTKAEQFDNFELTLRKSEQVELLDIDKCQFCNFRNVKIQHQEKIYRLPEILILHLKRFTVKSGQVTKIHTKWKLDQILYISKNKYVLTAVICHIGISADYGHYITVSNGARYDDELVTSMSYDQIPPQEIYMLFYLRTDA